MSKDLPSLARVSAPAVRAAKGVAPIAMMTAYDYAMARLVDASGMDIALVGDSLAMVMLGHDDTLSVTMDEMLHHVRAVARGCERALVVADMPFLSVECSIEQAVRNCGRMLADGGARAVKIEGTAHMEHIRAVLAAKIPVMGHIGLTPQAVAQMGGFRVQGKTPEAVRQLIAEAEMLADAGCFACVIECVPPDVAKVVTEATQMPTIGIGAGPHCDGQVLVVHDALCMYDRMRPSFVKAYVDGSTLLTDGLRQYVQEVRSGIFPDADHSFSPLGLQAKD